MRAQAELEASGGGAEKKREHERRIPFIARTEMGKVDFQTCPFTDNVQIF